MYYKKITVEDESSKKPIIYYNCDFCKKRSKKEKTIQTHIQTHHAELIQKIDEGDLSKDDIAKKVDYKFEVIEPKDNLKIKKAFHLADIHIRNYLRFDEYAIIFEKLFNFIKKEKEENPNDNNIIVVAGDVFHTKQRLSPEAILQGRDFFKNLSDLYPVFLICGNHDSVINNKNIKDSLSSVLSHSSFNLHYLKYSGIYRYHNLLFTVSSLLDDGLVNEDVFNQICENNPVDYDPIGDLKVGLYHGPIASSRNDTGWQMKGGFIIHDFKVNDFTLLGDIHKFQYLNDAKTVAYASSLISQSFSETDDDHGVLIWDFQTKMSKYQRFYNEYAFKSFVVKDDGYEDHKVLYPIEKLVPTYDTSLHFVPRFGRIRLVNDCSLYSVFLDRLHKFEKKFPETEIQVVSNTLSYINDKKVESSLSVDKEQFSIDFEAIMDKYLDDNFNGLNEDTKEWVINKMDFRNKKNMNNIQWKLLKMDFSNLLGYGQENTLDFRKYESRNVIGLFAENSCGKSSLLDIITFLLFSKINRNTSNNREIPKDIIHVNENSAYGSIYFEVSGKIYRVEKQMDRDQKGKIKITQYLHRLEPLKSKSPSYPTITFDKEQYELVDLTEEQRQKTDELITGLIGNYNDFIFTAIFLQSGNKNFREMTQKDRKEFLYHILGLNFFQSSFDKEQDEYKEAKTENKKLMEEIENLNHEVFEEQLSTNDLEKDDLSEHIADLKQIRSKLQQKIKILYSQSPEIIEDIQKQSNPFQYITNRLTQLGEIFEDLCMKEAEIKISLEKIENKSWKYIPRKLKIEKAHVSWENDRRKMMIELEKVMDDKRGEVKSLHLLKRDVLESEIEEMRLELVRLEGEIKEIRVKMVDFDEKEYNNGLESYNNEIRMLEKEKDILDAKLEEAMNDNMEIKNNNGSLTDEKIEKWKMEYGTLLEEKMNLEKENEERQVKIDKMEKQLESETIEDDMDRYRKDLNKLDKLNGELEFQMDIVKEFENHEYNPDCHICMKNMVVVKGEKAKKAIEEIGVKIDELKEKMDDTLPVRYDNYKKNKKALEVIYNNLRLTMTKISKRTNKLNELSDKLKMADTYLQNKKLIKKNKTLIETLILKKEEVITIWNNNPINLKHHLFLQNKSLLETNSSKLEKKQLELEQNEFYFNQKIENAKTEKENAKINASIQQIKLKITEMAEATDADYEGLQGELELEREGDKRKVVLMEELHKVEKEIEKTRLDKLKMEDCMRLLEKNKDTIGQIKEMEDEIKGLEDKLEMAQSKMMKLEKQRTEIEMNLDSFNRSSKKMEVNKLKMERLEVLIKASGRDGVILYVLDTYLPKITELLNDILHPFIDRDLELCLQDDNVMLNSYPHNQQTAKGKKENQVGIYGGMEAFMVDLAFKIVLARVASLPKPQMFFIDEGISAFDSKRISTIENLFDFLNTHFLQTIMISHIEGVKEKINQRIEIEKIGKYSKIIQ